MRSRRPKDGVARDIDSFNNDGSGITIGGDIYGIKSENVTLEKALVHHNGHQGLTFYGSKNVVVSGITAYDNTQNGINIEWSEDVTVRDSLSYHNGFRGFNTYGVTRGIWVEALTTRINGGSYIYGAEAGISTGDWEVANPATGIVEHGLTQDIAFINCDFTPVGSKPQLHVQTDLLTPRVGFIFPTQILLYNELDGSWKYKIDNKNNLTRNQLVPHVFTRFGVTLVIQ